MQTSSKAPNPPRQVRPGDLTVAQLAQRCIEEAANDSTRAVRLAGRYARGAKARAVVAAIGSTLLRTAAK